MKGAVSPVLKTKDNGARAKTALPTETFLNYNKLRARGISNHVIKVKNSVDIIKVFFTQIIASISCDTLKHIIRVSGKQSTTAPETVTTRKKELASPPPPPPFHPWASLNFVGLVFLGSIFILFSALR